MKPDRLCQPLHEPAEAIARGAIPEHQDREEHDRSALEGRQDRDRHGEPAFGREDRAREVAEIAGVQRHHQGDRADDEDDRLERLDEDQRKQDPLRESARVDGGDQAQHPADEPHVGRDEHPVEQHRRDDPPADGVGGSRRRPVRPRVSSDQRERADHADEGRATALDSEDARDETIDFRHRDDGRGGHEDRDHDERCPPASFLHPLRRRTDLGCRLRLLLQRCSLGHGFPPPRPDPDASPVRPVPVAPRSGGSRWRRRPVRQGRPTVLRGAARSSAAGRSAPTDDTAREGAARPRRPTPSGRDVGGRRYGEDRDDGREPACTWSTAPSSRARVT